MMTRKKKRRILELCAVLLFVLFLFVSVFSDPLGIRDCFSVTVLNLFGKVIPILFPFMIISRILSEFSDSIPIDKALGRFTRKTFNLPGAVAVPFFLGAICSFPVGSISAVNLFKKGNLSHENAERACALCNNTGPAFPVTVAGSLILGNEKCGWLIWAVQLCSAIVIGIIFGFNKKAESIPCANNGNEKNVLSVITESVSSAASSCITVAGSVVFFSLVADRLIIFLKITHPGISAIIYSIFEFSEGCIRSSKIGGAAGAAICAFAISFGGLSVILQSAIEMKKADLHIKYLIVFKILQGVLSSVIVFFITSVSDYFAPVRSFASTFASPANSDLISSVCLFTVLTVMLTKILHLIYQ